MTFRTEPAKKSKEEMEFDALNKEYTKKFGTPYVFNIGFTSGWDETLADIRKCIAEGKPQEEPDYKDEYVY